MFYFTFFYIILFFIIGEVLYLNNIPLLDP